MRDRTRESFQGEQVSICRIYFGMMILEAKSSVLRVTHLMQRI